MALTKVELEILETATKIVNERWVRGHFQTDGYYPDAETLAANKGQFCAMGAIRQATMFKGIGAGEIESVHVRNAVYAGLPWYVKKWTYNGYSPEESVINYNDSSPANGERIKKLFCNALKRETRKAQRENPSDQ